MQDKNNEGIELTDDELRELMSPLTDMPLLTPEKRQAIIAKLQPAIDSAIARETFQEGLRPRPVLSPRRDQIDEKKRRSS